MRRRTHEEDTRKRTHGREHTEENTRVEDSGAIAGGVMEALMIQRINSTEKFQRTDSDHH